MSWLLKLVNLWRRRHAAPKTGPLAWESMVRDSGPRDPADITQRYPFASWALFQVGTVVDDWDSETRDPRELIRSTEPWEKRAETVGQRLITLGLVQQVLGEMDALGGSQDDVARLLHGVLNLNLSTNDAWPLWKLIYQTWQDANRTHANEARQTGPQGGGE